jgi:hypothetical protein
MANSSVKKWKDPYEEQLKNYLQQIENRDQFSFDVNKDAMYQQLRENYERQGKLAMEDTMGQAATMTGGYGNSYAQTVGQQAYMQSMKDLNKMVPTIQSMAQDRYNKETEDLYTKYSLYKGLSDKSYNKYLADLKATTSSTDTAKPTYTALDQKKINSWRSQAEKGKWSDAVTTFNDMKMAGHDPLSAANIAMQGAHNAGVAITVKEIQEIGDKLIKIGVSEDDVAYFEGEWIGIINPQKNPYPISPTYNGGAGGKKSVLDRDFRLTI